MILPLVLATAVALVESKCVVADPTCGVYENPPECPRGPMAKCNASALVTPCSEMEVPEGKVCCQLLCKQGKLYDKKIPTPPQCRWNIYAKPGKCSKCSATCEQKNCRSDQQCCLDPCQHPACEDKLPVK